MTRPTRVAAMLSLLFVGCQEVILLGSIPPEAGDSSVPTDAAALVDASGPRCDLSMTRFALPEVLDNVNSQCATEMFCSDYSARLTQEGLRLWFMSDRGDDVPSPFVATRPNPDAPFNPPTEWPAVDSPEWVDTFAVERPLVRAIRDAMDCGILEVWDPQTEQWRADWAPNAPSGDFNVWLSQDRLRIYFASNRDSGQPGCGALERLYFAERVTTDEGFGAATQLRIDPPPAADERIANPSLTADERFLLFNLQPPVGPGRVILAERASPTEFVGARDVPFTGPTGTILHPFIAPDGCELYGELFVGADREIVRALPAQP